MSVVDQRNHPVQSFAPNLPVGVNVAGRESLGSSNNRLAYPSGIAIDKYLNLYITDTNNEQIMKWPANATIDTVFVSSSAICSAIWNHG